MHRTCVYLLLIARVPAAHTLHMQSTQYIQIKTATL